jgi:transposase
VTAALAAASLAVAVVNPRQVRDFAKAIGQLAKTDVLRRKLARLAYVDSHELSAIQAFQPVSAFTQERCDGRERDDRLIKRCNQSTFPT